MSSASCRKILTDYGFKGGDVDEIINDLSNVDSVNKYAKEIKGRLGADERLKASQRISEQRTKESIDSLHHSLKDKDKPFKSL